MSTGSRLRSGKRKNTLTLPERTKTLWLKGTNVNACGGTHVKNTKEVGRIKITRTKSKGADNKRIYYTVEGTP